MTGPDRRPHAARAHAACLQDGFELNHQIKRARAGAHLAPHPDQQRVPQLLAQPLKRMADGGLRSSQPLGGAGDMAFAHQHVEDGQQVQVDPT